MTTVLARFKIRRDAAADWTSVNPVLLEGEPGLETDTGLVKYGDGATAWSSLSYAAVLLEWGGIGGTLADQTDLQTALDAKQPQDSDLTAIAALTTTAFGRALLELASASALRTAAELDGGVTTTFAGPVSSITIENGIVTAIS